MPHRQKSTAAVEQLPPSKADYWYHSGRRRYESWRRTLLRTNQTIVASTELAGHAEGMMQGKQRGGPRHAWLTVLLSLGILAWAGLSTALAQTSDGAAATTQAKATGGGGGYYFEFRSRYAWDYGHTFVIHRRVGAPITRASVAGLSPVGDDATAWVVGHYVPVPAETGWTDGDTEEKYVSARYRV